MHNDTTDPSALENITHAVRAWVDEHRRAKLLRGEEHDREAEHPAIPSALPRSR